VQFTHAVLKVTVAALQDAKKRFEHACNVKLGINVREHPTVKLLLQNMSKSTKADAKR
jgi:hypothetical protein